MIVQPLDLSPFCIEYDDAKIYARPMKSRDWFECHSRAMGSLDPIEILARCITRWDNVMDAAGEPAVVDRITIESMDPVAIREISNEIIQRSTLSYEQKKP